MHNKYLKYYQRAATTYDSLRLDGREEIKVTTDIVGKFAKPNSGYLLDIGCGTARYTLSFEKLGFQTVGLDISFAQLKNSPQSNKKICGSIIFSPFANERFSCCTAILVLHQIPQPEQEFFYTEIMRVLKLGGYLVIKTRSHEAISNGWTTKYFPSALKINQNRYPDTPVIKAHLENVGFKHVNIIETQTISEMKTSDYILRVKNRHNSTLALLPQSEFAIGYKNLEHALSSTDTVLVPIRHTFVIVQK